MIEFAHAATTAANSPASIFTSMAPLALILVVFYFLVMRPQQKKFKAHQQMISELKKGDKVITSSGIAGRITKVGDQFFTVEIAPNVQVEIERAAVSSKIEG